LCGFIEQKLLKELHEVLHRVDREEVPISENLPDTLHDFMSEMKNNKYGARTFAVRLKATVWTSTCYVNYWKS
jgi:galacturonosyltransferase 12/13/14/15